MVKGISKQIILVQAPDPKLFEQAIFILNEHAQGVSEEVLVKEAQKILRGSRYEKRKASPGYGILWGILGALFMGSAWALTVLL